MPETARLATVAGITLCVIALAWLSRRAALDVDEHGGPGWIVGILVLFAPPVGLAAWLVLRGRGEGAS